MEFEWDDSKELRNIRKHGISFKTASLVFNDVNLLEIYDTENSGYEDRFNAIGVVGKVIFVVYTERRNKIRIISARIATSLERKLYYDNIYNN